MELLYIYSYLLITNGHHSDLQWRPEMNESISCEPEQLPICNNTVCPIKSEIDQDTILSIKSVTCFMTQIDSDDENECVIEDNSCIVCCQSNIEDDDIYKDDRDDLTIARDILSILQGYVSSDYKNIVDIYISRNSSIPEVQDSIYKSKQEIRKICSQWRKEKKSPILDQINDDNYVDKEYQNYLKEVHEDTSFKQKMEKISINFSSFLRQLPLCDLFILTKDSGKRMVPTAIDTCATNFLIGLDILQNLGFSLKDINNKIDIPSQQLQKNLRTI